MTQINKHKQKVILPNIDTIGIFPKYKVATVQASPIFLDREATVDKACHLIEEAAHQGAALVVFPESWVPGYPVWTNAVSRWNYSPYLLTEI
jgi:predicted amidohydrolase